ncbi:hypothetical protein ANO11243_034000 [Dothideomycetidae sp. 11243]|nr:hypothetical protein ANO11243_034000 [fungal sp. No.11243]
MASESLETITLPHLDQYPLYAGLFRDVANAGFLRKQLLEGNSEFEYTFLDAATILSREHLLAACFRAINDLALNRLRTKNVHSEIVFSLSPNNNIAESFKRFGISDSTRDIVAIKVATSPAVLEQDVATHLRRHIDGRLTRLTDAELTRLRDLGRIGKIYKFDAKALSEGRDPESETAAMLSIAAGVMALKGL